MVLAGDRYCGGCGTPAPDPGRLPGRPAPAGDAARIADEAEEPLFSHEPRRPAGPLNIATRFLCAAAYLNPGFASSVIENLLVTRRAVAPSVSFDVGPVLRHCLRARRNVLIRDAVLMVLVIAGLIVKLSGTIDFLIFALALGLLLPRARRRGGPARVLAYVVGGVVALGLAVLFAVFIGFKSPAPGGASLFGVVVTFLVLAVATCATEFLYRYITFLTLDEDLLKGTKRPQAISVEAERRIALVEGAQHGNITLHTGWFPFIGAGGQSKAEWSIAIRLDRAADEIGDDAGDGGKSVGKYVHIDPVDLHDRIGDRLRSLNDPRLPENERIATLTVTDRLVGSGLLLDDDPLFDAGLRTPYSRASREAVEAVIRHPQARLRYYQQVSLSDEGPAVMSRGREVVRSVDQEVAVSAFIYAAVEGHMLYLQFVLTALPPISALYRVIGGGYGTSMTDILLGSVKRVFGAIATAPFGMYTAFSLWLAERRLAKTYLSPGDDNGADYGTLVSVREMATNRTFRTYVEELDVKKYNSILSRLLLDTVRDYLADKKVDTSAFENSARSIVNGDVITISGNSAQVSNVGSHRSD
jgi:hypothetical protein